MNKAKRQYRIVEEKKKDSSKFFPQFRGYWRWSSWEWRMPEFHGGETDVSFNTLEEAQKWIDRHAIVEVIDHPYIPKSKEV